MANVIFYGDTDFLMSRFVLYFMESHDCLGDFHKKYQSKEDISFEDIIRVTAETQKDMEGHGGDTYWGYLFKLKELSHAAFDIDSRDWSNPKSIDNLVDLIDDDISLAFHEMEKVRECLKQTTKYGKKLEMYLSYQNGTRLDKKMKNSSKLIQRREKKAKSNLKSSFRGAVDLMDSAKELIPEYLTSRSPSKRLTNALAENLSRVSNFYGSDLVSGLYGSKDQLLDTAIQNRISDGYYNIAEELCVKIADPDLQSRLKSLIPENQVY